MLKNYIKIAFRNLAKTRLYTLINVFGLAVGMAASILIILFVIDELTFDRFHKDHQRIYRIFYEVNSEQGLRRGAKVPFPVKQVLLDNYPEVEQVVRFYDNKALSIYPVIRYQDKVFVEENFMMTDPEVFEFLDFKLIKGNPATALADTYNVVLTEETAKRYFGDEDPIGRKLKYQKSYELTVTGVVKDLPSNSHIQFDFLSTINLQRYDWKGGPDGKGYDLEEDWNWGGAWLYLKLYEGTDPAILTDKLDFIVQQHFNKNDRNKYLLKIQPLADIHLYSGMNREMTPGASASQVYGFLVIALLVLGVACINFMNLATAKSATRSMEVGLRKVLGAEKKQLIYQFMGEAMLISMCSMILAGLLVELLLGPFNRFTGKTISIDYLNNPVLILFMLAGGVLVGFISGSYPALYLASFKPVRIVRGPASDKRANRLRKGLVMVQFVVSIVLIIWITVVFKQLNYFKTKKLGFDKENVLVITNGWRLLNNFDAFKNRLINQPDILMINSGHIPGTFGWNNTFTPEGLSSNEAVSMAMRHVGLDFLKMYQIDLVEGRNFQDSKLDSAEAILLNKAAVAYLGWENNALGKTLTYTGGSDNRTTMTVRVIGVVEDFHFESLHKKIRPAVFRLSSFGDLAVKIKTEDIQSTISKIEAGWKEFIPEYPFIFSFLDQDLNNHYNQEQKLSTLIQIFTSLAILIASLGLFGLVAFSLDKRSREIGIRKVMGASSLQIFRLVGLNFIKLIGISFLIGSPLAYYLSSNWLQDFAYRIAIKPDVFVIPLALIFAITLITISYQCYKAATRNPVVALKEEHL